MSTYAQARRDTTRGEQKLLKDEYNQGNEAEFAKKATHTAKNLSDIYTNQQLSVTVAATPRGGTHKKDLYTGSITVSDQILTSLNDFQKEALLKDHAKKIYTEFKALQEFVNTHNSEQ